MIVPINSTLDAHRISNFLFALDAASKLLLCTRSKRNGSPAVAPSSPFSLKSDGSIIVVSVRPFVPLPFATLFTGRPVV